MQSAEMDELQDLLAQLRYRLAGARLALLERKYRPDQPRVPAGSAGAGQWTDGGGSVGLTDIANRRFVRHPVDLRKEEDSGSSHAISDHVGKTDSQLKQALVAKDIEIPGFSFKNGDPQGSFDSVGAANEFTNEVINQRAAEVDRVVSGAAGDNNVLISARIGSVTGKEAYRTDGDETFAVRIQPTFGAGVVIRRANNANGFIVRTAFPMNVKPDRMR